MSSKEIKIKREESNHYKILQVNRNCSETDLKQSYRRLALKYHPDKNSNEGAKEAFLKVTNSYSFLMEQRKKYKEQEEIQKGKMKSQFKEEDMREKKENKKKNMQKGSKDFEQFFNEVKKKMREWEEREKRKKFQKEQYERNKREYQQNLKREEKKRKKEEGQNRKKIIIIVIIVVILSMIFSFPVQRTHKLYSFQMSQKYKYEVRTKLQKKYYVGEDFFNPGLPEVKKKEIQFSIDKNYLNNLKKQCLVINKNIKKLSLEAYKYHLGNKRTKILKMIKNIDQKPCDDLYHLKLNFPSYIDQLVRKK